MVGKFLYLLLPLALWSKLGLQVLKFLGFNFSFVFQINSMVSPIISSFSLFLFNMSGIVIDLYICLFSLSILIRLMNSLPGLVFFLIHLSHIFDFLCTFQTFHFYSRLGNLFGIEFFFSTLPLLFSFSYLCLKHLICFLSNFSYSSISSSSFPFVQA